MPRREVEIEQKLTEHIQSFLLELGPGFISQLNMYQNIVNDICAPS